MIDEETDIPVLLDYLDVKTIKVHAPTLVVFVCGGIANDISKPPQSLRDAFLRIWSETPLRKYQFVIAEAENYAPPKGEYQEVLKFEANVAQLAELLLLFSESAGSFAELGVFVMDGEVAPRMMVVVDDHNYDSDSFIKWGPLYTLKTQYGEEAVCVLALKDVNVASIRDVSSVDLKQLRQVLEKPLNTRLNMNRGEPRTFDPSRHGHVTKLIVGLIQHYSALTLIEISKLLSRLHLPLGPGEIKKHLMCAEIFQWIYSEKRGLEVYYAAVADKAAIAYETIGGRERPDAYRWRADIRSYWKAKDFDRFKVIAAAAVRSGK